MWLELLCEVFHGNYIHGLEHMIRVSGNKVLHFDVHSIDCNVISENVISCAVSVTLNPKTYITQTNVVYILFSPKPL